MKRLLISAVAVALTLPASAQFVRQEVLGFASTNATTKQTLLGEKAPPVLLACHLRLAKAGPKQPVVMLMHGAGGVGAHDGALRNGVASSMRLAIPLARWTATVAGASAH